MPDIQLGAPVTLSSYATADLPSGSAGDLAYDSTVGKIKYHDGNSWSAVGSGGGGTPVGGIIEWGNAQPPAGYLVCDGTAVSRTTYADLFAVIGTTFGVGDGSTTFNLPNFKGRTPLGVGLATATGATTHTLAQMGGEETHTLTTAEIPAHTHSITDPGHIHEIRANSFAGDRRIVPGPLGADGDKYSFTDSGNDASSTTAHLYAFGAGMNVTATNSNAGGGGAHNTLPPYLGVYFVICYALNVTGAGKSVNTIGDGTTNPITVTHGLNARPVNVEIMEASTFLGVEAKVEYLTVNTVRLTFSTAPAAGQYVVTCSAGSADITAPKYALYQRRIGDTGVVDQIRAGRRLTAADFTAIGLSAPVGLYPLGDPGTAGQGHVDTSGNSRNLSTKGSAIAAAKGVTGIAQEALSFPGAVTDVLYRADTGAGDPFRITTGTWGAVFRCDKRNTHQEIISKIRVTGNQMSYGLSVQSDNKPRAFVSMNGSSYVLAQSNTDVADGRLHFAYATFDGTMLRLYVDGVLDAMAPATGHIFPSTAPFNIGGYNGDASTAVADPFCGVIDEAFVTGDVLNEDQINFLRAVAIPHGLPGQVPTRVDIAVRRAREGKIASSGDFIGGTARRIYSMSAGSLADTGANSANLTANGSVTGEGNGPDGSRRGAMYFDGSSAYLSATDSGLPSGGADMTAGVWFQTPAIGATHRTLVTYGTHANGPRLLYVQNTGLLATYDPVSGVAFTSPMRVDDAFWHFGVIVYSYSDPVGIKRRLYLDGELVVSDTATPWSIALGGSNWLQYGRLAQSGGEMFQGHMARGFIANWAMKHDEIQGLHTLSSMPGMPSLSDPGAHVEGIDTTNVYCLFDDVPMHHQVDLKVAP